MTNLAASAPLKSDQTDRLGAFPVLAAAWLLALGLIALQIAPLAMATFQRGILFDNDDAMRLVQLREWLGGQGWTDLTQHRVDPPDSPVAHWSRIVELPLAGIILPLRAVATPLEAERIAITVWPCILMAGFVLGLLAMARRLVAPPALIAGALIVALNPVLLFQFLPGRIDHHGAQMALALALVALAGRGLFRRSAAAGIAAGAVSAVMLAIGLETLPLVGAVAAAFGTAWIVEGASARRSVAAFGTSLVVATLCAFMLTVPPGRWSLPTVDSLSLPWLWLAVGGGVVLVGLSCLPTAPGRWRQRAALAFSAAALVCGVFVIAWPECLRGPYGNLDPLARSLWLVGVGEAQPLPALVLRNPSQFLFFLAFPLIGWLALGVAAIREGRREPRLFLVFALSTVALGVTLQQMRGAPFASMLGLFGWLYMIDRALQAVGTRPAGSAILPAVLTVGACALALPYGWNEAGAAIIAPSSHAQASCGDPADMAALAAEPRGLVLAPLRLGPRILVATPHDILAAPYHRNNRGNHVALAALSGSPAEALAAVRENKVRYVAICLGDADLDRLGSATSDPLVRRLAANDPPDWLQPIRQVGAIRAWRVVTP